MIVSKIDELFDTYGARHVSKVLAATVVFVIIAIDWLNPVFYKRQAESLFDIIYSGSSNNKVSENSVIIVGLDRKTFADTELTFAQFFPMYEKIIRRLTKAGAKAIAFDISITTAPDKNLADSFIDAVKMAPPFIMATQLPSKDTAVPSMPESAQTRAIVKSPFIHTGYVDLVTDNSSPVIRQLELVTIRRKHRYVSFSLMAASLASECTLNLPADNSAPVEEITGDKWSIPLKEGLYRLSFLAPEGGIPYVSCGDLLKDSLLPDALFKDKVVVFGPTEAGFSDYHLTPAGNTLGAQIHGNVIRAILKNSHLVALNSFAMVFLIGIAGFASFYIGSLGNLKKAIIILLIFFVALWWLITWCSMKGIWISPLPFLLATGIPFFIPPLIKVLAESFEAARIQKLFGQFVSREVFKAIMDSKEGLNLSGSEMEATILFSDIRGFTTMSERKGAKTTFTILNQYLAEMVQVIFKNGGRLDKFIGDAIMAVYGAPFSRPDDALRAVKTALEMKERLGALNKQIVEDGGEELKIGIGLCTGKLYAGVLGTLEKMEYAVIGDTVNTASRLEHMTKDEGVTILLSQSTYDKVKTHVEVMDLGEREVRGRDEKIHVYALMEIKQQSLR